MADQNQNNQESNPNESRVPLTEPAPKPSVDPTRGGTRTHVHDGLDNSDLRMLLNIAKQEADRKA